MAVLAFLFSIFLRQYLFVYAEDLQTVVAFGDSVVAGVGATPGNGFVSVLERLVNQPIINAGKSGDTTASALARLESDVLSHDPDIVIVFLGGNDILQFVPKETTLNNLKIIVERIQQSGAKVLLLGIHAAVFRFDYETGYQQIANETGAHYVPNVMMGIIGFPQYMSDAVHPNNAGHELIAQRVAPTLQNMLNETNNEENPVIAGSCSVNVLSRTDTNQAEIVWTAFAAGGTGSYVFNWTGTDGLAGTTSQKKHLYTTPGVKTGTVTISSGQGTTSLTCKGEVLPFTGTTSPLRGSCSVTASSFSPNRDIFWNSSGAWSVMPYEFSWSGTDGLSGSTSQVRKVYTTGGLKTGTVTITSANGEEMDLTCQTRIASSTSQGGCFIATAAYGTEMEPEVEMLREFRDERLLPNPLGKKLVDFYYSVSPPIAHYIEKNEVAKNLTRRVLSPVIYVIDKTQ